MNTGPKILLAVTISFLLICFVPDSSAQNLQVNTPDNNSPTHDNFTTESETNHASFGSTIVVGWNSSVQAAAVGSGNVTSMTGYGYSTNGGVSFVDAGLLTPASGQINVGDPALAVDRLGNFYFATLSVNSLMTLGGSRVAVARSTSTSPTVTFGTPTLIAGLLNTGSPFEDKEFIAVDTTGGGNDGRVYLAWSEFASLFSTTAQVLFTYSTSTTPLTFATPIALSTNSALFHGAMPAVGPGGEIYVVWGEFAGSTERIHLVRSTNGGSVFANPDPMDPNPDKTVATVTPTPSSLGMRTRGFPFVAIDRTGPGSPTRGNIYIVFQADPDGSGPDRSDVFFVRSTDGGVTWSAPRSINAAPAVTINPDTTTHDNWQPSISVSPANGHIKVSFYDRRNDPANTAISVFEAISTDAGLTWFNQQVSSVAFNPSVGYDPLIAPTYMGDYNSNASDTSGFHLVWGDVRNLCTPPGGATNPCSPAGRGDQDVFYNHEAALSGADLFITPWGYVTGIGPLWQTPDIFVVDAGNNVVNASKGVVNLLRARVRNLGNAAATGVVVRFRYAPIFVGLTDSMFKQIDAPLVDFAAAGDPSGNDLKIVPVNWDLTNLSDTNGGLWPQPIGAFDHFCVKVTVEFAADINQGNNAAQNNFVDVQTTMGPHVPFRFLLGNPYRKPVEAELVLDQLPEGYRAQLRESEVAFNKPFRLKPEEVRVITIMFERPDDLAKQPPEKDVVAQVSMKIGRDLVGGFSARLARADDRKHHGQVFDASYDSVFKAILEVMRRREERVALADPKKGLINSASIPASTGRLREIADPKLGESLREQDGRYLLTFRLRRTDAKRTEVDATLLIIVNNSLVDSPLGGQPVPSNGSLERLHLEEIARILAQ
ncbi:MAG TPA: sialidase family protein [Candidatus Sulfotelmatobacter sp.]|nr:sialidase family protein [Candidatus Sulfotelmatobacter sp.]